MKFIPQKDRDPRTNEMRLMFHMLGFGFSYIETDLLLRGIEKHEKMGNKLSLREGIELHSAWEKKWEKYTSESKPNE